MALLFSDNSIFLVIMTGVKIKAQPGGARTHTGENYMWHMVTLRERRVTRLRATVATVSEALAQAVGYPLRPSPVPGCFK